MSGIAPGWYDQATDAFCHALGLDTKQVTHLAVGPNYTVARIIDPSNPLGEGTVRISRNDEDPS